MNQNQLNDATVPRSVDQQQAYSESDDWRDFAAHFERREGFAPNCRDYQVITLLWYWKQSRQRLKVATERYMSAAASYHVSPWDADAIRKYGEHKALAGVREWSNQQTPEDQRELVQYSPKTATGTRS